MTSTTLERPEVEAYLAAVRAALSDLPPEERDDLLAEVEASLLESAEESGAPVSVALRPPEEFAAELREAAGLAGAAGASGTAGASVVALLRRLAAGERAARLLAVARELAPIWWVARGYAAVAGAALLLDKGWPLQGWGVGPTGLAAALAVVASVWLGLRGRAGHGVRRVALALNLVLLVALVPVVQHTLDVAGSRVYVVQAPEPQAAAPDLAHDGVPIANIYPYTRDGVLLHDVLLYDGDGRPLDLGDPGVDPNRRVLVARDGTPILNSFPIRYYEPGTEVVARPDLAPPVVVPHVATPPLKAKATPVR